MPQQPPLRVGRLGGLPVVTTRLGKAVAEEQVLDALLTDVVGA